MTDRLILFGIAFFYCVMVSFTHGYVMDRNDCYINPPEYGDTCSMEPVMKAIVWPAYLVFHSGTLMFEPKNMDR